MKEALTARLKRLQSLGTGERAPAGPPNEQTVDPGPQDTVSELPNLGFVEIAENVWCRRTRHRLAGQTRARIAGYESTGVILPDAPGPYVFLDTETTGLGSGAGTVAFLTGCGTLEPDDTLLIRQFLLSDYPGEPAYLAVLAGILTPDCCMVSYNGKSFDSNVLQTRFLMNGIPWTRPRQLDLLYSVRRLFRTRLSRCNLATVERDLLFVQRQGDIPGAEVPDRYFAFLETGAAEVLRPVVYHHEQDIVSLVKLLVFLEDDAASPPSHSRADPVALARLIMPGAPTKAMAMLSDLVRHDSPFGDSRRAMVLLAGMLKRAGDVAQAVPLWESLFRNGGSAAAGIELAKYYEHRLGDPVSAIEVCREIQKRTNEGQFRDALLHRMDRLSRRISESEIDR